MKLDNFTFVNDGQSISDDFMDEWDIKVIAMFAIAKQQYHS